MTIIDIHTHIYPVKIAKKATEAVCNYYNLSESLEGTADVLLEREKAAGISNAVLLPVATKAENVRSINNFILSEQKAHKEFIGFGAIHANLANLIQEVDYILESGLWGIKIHPEQQNFPIDDNRLFPMYDYLQSLPEHKKIPILFHCGDPVSNLSHPQRLKTVLKNFPNLNVIAAHLGGWSIFDTAVQILQGQNCYFDISSTMAFVAPEKLKEYIKKYGEHKILFGSDFPMWDPVHELERFYQLPLTTQEQEAVLYKNAQTVLNYT